MKTKIILLLVSLFSLSNLDAQRDSTIKTEIFTGFTLVPQSQFSIKEIDKGGRFFSNLFPQLTISHGKFFAVGLYSISANNFGSVIGFKPIPEITTYIVGIKNTLVSGGYAGIGIGTPLASGRSTGFIELGSSTKEFKTMVYIGMFIPFTIKIK